MSIVCGIPFAGGTVVAADRSYLDQAGHQGFGDRKLAIACGGLFSLTGKIRNLGPDGRVAFDLQRFISYQAPPPPPLQDNRPWLLPQLPRFLDYIDRAWQRLPGDGMVQGAFWWPGAVASFRFHAGQRATHEATLVRRDDRAAFWYHGRAEADDIIPQRRLSESSRALLARKPLVRDITRDEAVAFVIDFQAAAARHVPQAIGGGVDVRVVTPAGVEEVAS